MSVIKRLGNLAKGTLKTWSDDDVDRDLSDVDRAAAEDELRRLEDEARALEGKAPVARPSEATKPSTRTQGDPLAARREAIEGAFASGVLSADERDAKLAEVAKEADEAERGLPPKPRKRTL